ncbi:RnfABCDGE type electron transport complex subunit D [Aliterella atlantica]|uniref:Na+-transporting NADH:ubiquinone oxidoreductase, subunit NqrB n=1 Tax=Aliterella atlantica CENA595 TaxID=1618023 RepID=A0A0D8ZSI4_9CYAN|nr:RnfABCDGE type electron transport complex subunit D [Aliterella atlantica]KJH71312.1 Na+-transporting NADH:ubiquinone oxidoreductase, subunit NqrB [Aliterella atlantica CENA595]
MLFQDARDYQILFLASFLMLGIATRDWTLKPELIGAIIATCLVTQWTSDELVKYLKNKEDFQLSNPLKLSSLRSAIITALGLSLLLRADSFSTVMLAGSLAILSKHIFKFNNKHFFNPANFGIISVLTLTTDAWVSPGQWGDEWWYALLFFGAGGIVLKQVGRWDTTAIFLGTYASLEAIRNVWLGWTWDVFLHRLMSGSLLLFALFMLTDPRSIPNAKFGRCIWAICIAGLTFVLRNQYYVPTAVFWALFALAPLSVILDIVWTAPRFNWLKASNELIAN